MSRKRQRPTDSFVAFIADQLDELPGYWARPMFGGHGLYAEGCFIGIIAGGRLYFRTDEQSRPDYTRRNMPVFQPPKGPPLRNYYEVPADVIEDRLLLMEWAQRAIAAAQRQA